MISNIALAGWLIVWQALSASTLSGKTQNAQKAARSKLSYRQAEKILFITLRRERVFPHIKPECLYADKIGQTREYFMFTVRFDQATCGGDSFSNLLDRFVVLKKNGAVMWHDDAAEPGQPEIKSLSAYFSRYGHHG